MTKDKDTEDDKALWDFVARTVKPLRNNKFHPDHIDIDPGEGGKRGGEATQPQKPKDVPSRAKHESIYSNPLKDKTSPADSSQGGREIDKRLDERLRRGQLPIDMQIDLHGHTQAESHHILQTTLMAAHRAQKRCILVITGKGRHSPREEDSRKLHHGILKQRVPEWLSEPPLSNIVLKYHGARPKDGGAGALYVLLRRKR